MEFVPSGGAAKQVESQAYGNEQGLLLDKRILYRTILADRTTASHTGQSRSRTVGREVIQVHLAAHSFISLTIWCKSSPIGVRVYSTVTGTVGNTVRVRTPFSSIWRSVLVSALGLTEAMLRCCSPNRRVPQNNSLKTRNAHLPPMTSNVFSTEHKTI